jgi:hypothetical protein
MMDERRCIQFEETDRRNTVKKPKCSPSDSGRSPFGSTKQRCELSFSTKHVLREGGLLQSTNTNPDEPGRSD